MKKYVEVMLYLKQDLTVKPEEAFNQIKSYFDMELNDIIFVRSAPDTIHTMNDGTTQVNFIVRVDSTVFDNVKETVENELITKFKQKNNFIDNIECMVESN